MTEDLVSIRNLIEGGGTPLRSFEGVFDGYETAPADGYEGTRVLLNYMDIDNVVAISPYTFPTAVLNFGLSNKNKSKWGYFGNSLAAFLADGEDIKDCKGKKMSLVYCDGVDGRPTPKPIWNRDANVEDFPDKMVPTPVWIVTGLDGATAGAAVANAGNAAEWAEENLIGKNISDFNKWALVDSKIRAAPDVQKAIVDKSFVQGLLALDKVVKDDDDIFRRPSA